VTARTLAAHRIIDHRRPRGDGAAGPMPISAARPDRMQAASSNRPGAAAREQAAAIARVVGPDARGSAPDLNTPMTIISGYFGTDAASDESDQRESTSSRSSASSSHGRMTRECSRLLAAISISRAQGLPQSASSKS